MGQVFRLFSSHVSLFADNIKLIQSISTSADHVQLQTDLDNLDKWCDGWQFNFNATKFKVIHFGQATHSYGGYCLNGILLDSVDCYKDFSILFDTGLKFHQHASGAAMKANTVLACSYEKSVRGFINFNEFILLQLYKSMIMIWPILEYGWQCNLGTLLHNFIRSTQVWGYATVCNKTCAIFKRWVVKYIKYTNIIDGYS